MAHRIFLVEDHEWVREMQTRMLALQPGLEVCGAASDAASAMAALPAGADIVLIDLGLVDSSGFDLLRDIRARWPNLPCVVLSGKPAVEYAAAAHDAGAAGYVEKGDAPGLLATIYDLLGPAPDRHEA